MNKNKFKIGKIPAVLWGNESEKLIIAVHGRLSNKEDTPIEMLAEYAVKKGIQVLSFDLPEHGERKDEGTLCKVQTCVVELSSVIEYARTRWTELSLFANSMGAYFSLLAFRDVPLKQALFLSPVVDMRKLIENMMTWFDVSEARLQAEQTVSTPIGQDLYWDYYTYVKEHPIDLWNTETHILYGTKDDTTDFQTISDFSEKFSCDLQIAADAEHYFHTKEQLGILDDWFSRHI